jgi:hypothetical protein
MNDDTSFADPKLDSFHHGLIERVEGRDTSTSRRELAAHFRAMLTDDIEDLTEQQREAGTLEQIAALEATGWTGWARYFFVAGALLVVIDAQCGRSALAVDLISPATLSSQQLLRFSSTRQPARLIRRHPCPRKTMRVPNDLTSTTGSIPNTTRSWSRF